MSGASGRNLGSFKQQTLFRIPKIKKNFTLAVWSSNGSGQVCVQKDSVNVPQFGY